MNSVGQTAFIRLNWPKSLRLKTILGEDADIGQCKATQETTQEKILVLLRLLPTITRKALAENIGIGPDGVKYHLEKLKAAGIIRHVGATKAGQWEVLK